MLVKAPWAGVTPSPLHVRTPSPLPLPARLPARPPCRTPPGPHVRASAVTACGRSDGVRHVQVRDVCRLVRPGGGLLVTTMDRCVAMADAGDA